MWMIGLAGCEGMVIQSSLSRMERATWILSCNEERMEGVFRSMLIPSEALTASNEGIEAEKTNAEPLMRYVSHNLSIILVLLATKRDGIYLMFHNGF
jgi:hypothetical protein